MHIHIHTIITILSISFAFAANNDNVEQFEYGTCDLIPIERGK